MNKHFCFASAISTIQQSDMFMTVKARMFETPKANLNGVRVTPAFLDEIVENSERYVGLPLYADIRALKNGNYNRLGHLYDARTGEFHSTQIGSFYLFEKEDFDGGSYLIGYARLPKRDKKLSKAIAELFADESLKFSFEICAGECEELEDGTTLIDASENNYLEGTAIVTNPACEEAVALEFVAQHEADDTRKGDEEMAEVEKLVAEETEATTPAVAEQTEETVETAEAEVAKEKSEAAEENAEEESAACKKDKENAEVYVHETSVEEHRTYMHDTETGKDVSQVVTIETSVGQPIEGNIVEDANGGIQIAEGGEESGTETPGGQTETETPEEQTVTDPPANNPPEQVVTPPAESTGNDVPEDIPVVEDVKKKTAEELIAELAETVNSLKAEIKALKETKSSVTASAKEVELNPFMGSISTEKKFGLLEKAEPNTNYSLLEKA